MKTYILKYDVYNDIVFPQGTIVKVNNWEWEFEVAQGKLKGEKGHIADGMDEWLLHNTIENRTTIRAVKMERQRLFAELKKLDKQIKRLPTATLMSKKGEDNG